MELKVKGLVEFEVVKKNGEKKIYTANNNFVIKGEDQIAKFFACSFASDKKYDDVNGDQGGYFDFMAVGTGFKTPTTGSTTVVVLPNKPIGILDEMVDVYDSRSLVIHSGANAGVERVIAENGYNPANASFGNLPTLTVTVPFSATVAGGVQFSVSPTVEESALQGEGRPDFNGATFTTVGKYRVPIYDKKILSHSSEPKGENNEVYLQAVLDVATITGGSSIFLVEAGLFNTLSVPVTPDVASGNMAARVLITPIAKAPDDIINIRWRLRFGSPREFSI